MGQSVVSVEKIVMKDELTYRGVTLLTYTIEYPQFGNSPYAACLTVMNSFYKAIALEFQKRCETELFQLAIEQYKMDMENGYPIRLFEGVLTFEITYCTSCIVSLYFDKYVYAGGAHGITERQSQAWNLQRCGVLKLRRLICCSISLKDYVVKAVINEIRADSTSYFEDYKDLASENFDENSFYCTQEGIVVYYQPYDIAPYSSGIREFTLTYSDCVLDPNITCFFV